MEQNPQTHFSTIGRLAQPAVTWLAALFLDPVVLKIEVDVAR